MVIDQQIDPFRDHWSIVDIGRVGKVRSLFSVASCTVSTATDSSAVRIRVLMIGSERVLLEAVLAALDNSGTRAISVDWVAAFAGGKVEAASSPVEMVLFDPPEDREDAVEALREIRAVLPEAKLIVFRATTSEEQVLAFIEAGASMVVSRHSPVGRVVSSIQEVMRGEVSFPPSLISLVVARIRELSNPVACSQPGLLSARQRETMQLISNGLSNKEIANHLGVSSSTAKNHVHKVLKKLNAHRRRDAIRKA